MKSQVTCLILCIIPFFINGFYNPYLSDNPFWFWALDILTWIILPIICFSFLGYKRALTFEETGIKIPKSKYMSIFFISLLMCPIAYFTYKYSDNVGKIIFPINYISNKFSYNQLMPETGYQKLLVGLHFSITAGLVEELLYRGLFKKVITYFTERKLYFVILSSLVFSSVHWEGGIQNLFPSFITGLLFAIVYVKTKSLWPCIIGHIFTDAVYFLG